MKDLIDRKAVLKIINDELEYSDNVYATSKCITIRRAVNDLPSAQPELAQNLHTTCTDAISRQDAIDAFWKLEAELRPSAIGAVLDMLKNLPSIQPNLQPTCNQLATDTISRQAAIDLWEDGK